MERFSLSARSIPLHEGYDVIVAGGGPAGCAAAAAAAREGARTLLIESSGALGGMATGGMVPAWCPYSDGEQIVYRGISEEVFRRLKAEMPHVPAGRVDWVPIESEKLKRIYDDLVTGAGAEVLFFSLICGVEKDKDGRLTEVIVANKAGLSAYRAAVFVDATGDADLAAYAGAPFEEGDAESGEVQPGSLCFRMTNVDEYAYLNSPDIYPGNNPKSPYADVVKSGRYPYIDGHLCQNLVAPRAVGFNAGHIYDVYPDRPETISAAMIRGRRMAENVRRALADCRPDAFANATVSETAALMGIRESRRIVGEYVLTADDYAARRDFPDEISRCCYYIDMHAGRTEQKKMAEGKLASSEARAAHYGKGESYGVPYRALLPKNTVNLLVAGRSISCDRAVQASVRIMPACMTTGEAAGVAAALAARGDGCVRAVATDTLRDILRKNGAYIH